VNIDHVATLRNARGGHHPDPVRAARAAIEAGADGITAHLREDRRHIRDEDIARLRAEIARPLNLEMAPTEEMLAIALKTRPPSASARGTRKIKAVNFRIRSPNLRRISSYAVYISPRK